MTRPVTAVDVVAWLERTADEKIESDLESIRDTGHRYRTAASLIRTREGVDHATDARPLRDHYRGHLYPERLDAAERVTDARPWESCERFDREGRYCIEGEKLCACGWKDAPATGTCPRGCVDVCLEDATGRIYANCARRSEPDEWDGIADLSMKLEMMLRRWESIVPVGTPEEIARHRTLVEDHAADVRRIINRAGRE